MARTTKITVCLVMIGLTGCARKKREPGRYYNEEAGFSVKLPAGWEVYLSDNATMAANFKAGGNISANALITVWCPNDNLLEDAHLEDCFEKTIAPDTRSHSDISEVERGDTNIGGLKAKWQACSYTFRETRSTCLLYVTTRGRRCITISYSSAPETFDKHRDMFESITASLTIQGD